jgi:phospholipid/cholesterol/gamma-HCH transport system substrate-binding protein
MKSIATLRGGLLVVVLALTLSGCSWTGLNSISLPFTKGGGDDSIEITVELENAANLVPNSEVKYAEVTIGSVRKIELDDWVATLTVGLEGDAKVPSDVVAGVAQKSLLGAEYLELKDPPTRTASTTTDFLRSGDEIGLDRTSRYPETEEVLTAASMLLNGGGLPQLQTISHELNAAFGGRAKDIRSFMVTVSRFTSRLDRQRDNIAATLQQLDRISSTVVGDRAKVGRVLEELPRGFRTISEERRQLVRTLQSLDDFGHVAHRVVNGTKRDLQENLDHLAAITEQLADHGDTLADSFDGLTYPFNVRAADNVIFGDYINLITEIEVSPGNLTKYWLGGTPLDGLFPAVIEGSPTGPAGDATDPLATDPLDGLLDGVDGLLGGNRGDGEDRPPRDQTNSGPANDDGPLSNLLNPLLGGN